MNMGQFKRINMDGGKMSKLMDMLRSEYRKYKAGKIYTEEARKKSLEAGKKYKSASQKQREGNRIARQENFERDDRDLPGNIKHTKDLPSNLKTASRSEQRAYRRETKRFQDDVERRNNNEHPKKRNADDVREALFGIPF